MKIPEYRAHGFYLYLPIMPTFSREAALICGPKRIGGAVQLDPGRKRVDAKVLRPETASLHAQPANRRGTAQDVTTVTTAPTALSYPPNEHLKTPVLPF